MIDALLTSTETLDEVRLLREEEDVTDALARAAWSVLAEPGDGIAGVLIQALGAEEALRYAVDGTQRDGEVDALLDTADPRVRRAVAEGRRRWAPRVEARAVRDALRGAREVGAKLVLPGDDLWPRSLDDLGANAPIALWVRGDPHRWVVTPRYW